MFEDSATRRKQEISRSPEELGKLLTPVFRNFYGENIIANIHYFTGQLHWAKVLGDPVPNYNRDGNEWTFDFTPDDLDAVKAIEPLAKKIKNKGDERGDFIQLKQKETTSTGKRNRPITVVDARNRPWNPAVKLGNKTLAEVKIDIVPYKTTTGVYPLAIRVLELVPYVRQEFAPLPEDSEYAAKADEYNVFEEDLVEDEPEMVDLTDDDPLGLEE